MISLVFLYLGQRLHRCSLSSMAINALRLYIRNEKLPN